MGWDKKFSRLENLRFRGRYLKSAKIKHQRKKTLKPIFENKLFQIFPDFSYFIET